MTVAGRMDEVVAELRAQLPAERLALDPEKLEEYGRDESDLGTFPPAAVVWVKSAEEVQRVFAIASRHRVPVVPVGARSGKSGGSLAVHGGIAV